VYCWDKDKEFAVEKLKERFARGLDQISRLALQVKAELPNAQLEERAAPATTRKPRP
jgi:hypothetical protein